MIEFNELDDDNDLYDQPRKDIIKLYEIADNDDDNNTWRIKHALISTVRDIGTS